MACVTRQFKDTEARKVWEGTISRKLPMNIQVVARKTANTEQRTAPE
jgi:hypothetical protein